jgi:hypothetical protein
VRRRLGRTAVAGLSARYSSAAIRRSLTALCSTFHGQAIVAAICADCLATLRPFDALAVFLEIVFDLFAAILAMITLE